MSEARREGEGTEGDAPLVLVVEDDADLRRVLRLALETARPPVRVAEAADAHIALDRLEADGWAVDLVLTDLTMPGMSGETLLERLQARAPHLPVVVLTSDAGDETILRCMRRGASDYLVKPVSVPELQRTVAATLARASAGAPADLPQLLQPVTGWVELTATSHVEYVERFRRFTELLYGTSLSEETKFQLRMALDELGRNAVEWGNRDDPRKRIHLTYLFLEDQIVVKIEDEGEGFETARVEDPTLDPLGHIQRRIASGKRLGGFGVHLIRKLMDDVLYSAKGNVVILTKRLTEAERAPAVPFVRRSDAGGGAA